jgi:hypothetical protein
MEKILTKLVSELRQNCGDNLLAVVLYGSSASGDFHNKYSDLNVLCVFKDLSANSVRKAGSAIAGFVKQGNPAPMLFSQDEVENGNDVFPIEFLDIQSNHRLLYGEDIFTSLKVGRENHRLEVEHELRSKLIGLRQNYLTASRDSKSTEQLMLRSLSSILTLFRHVLMLRGEEVSSHKRDIVQMASQKCGLDESVFLRLLDIRSQKKRLAQEEVEGLFASYWLEIEKMVKIVDQLP